MEYQDNERSNLVEGLKKLKSGFNDIFTYLAQMDLDEIVKLHSEKIDHEILATTKREGWKFIGGIFTVTYVTEKTFSLAVSLYYQDSNGEMIEQKAVTPRDMKYLKPRAVQELMRQKKLEYHIEEPVKRPPVTFEISDKEDV